MWLESLAEQAETVEPYPFVLAEPAAADAPLTVDTRPLIRELVADRQRGVAAPVVARRFHHTLAEVVVAVSRLLRVRTGVDQVALSGGVFLNGILTAEVERRLVSERFQVYRQRMTSPGDGGLSLGQLAVGSALASEAD
jgi:hydrogenase maturation protein HypF